jgi:hypothetical protein
MGLACASAAMAQTVPPGPPQFFSAPLHAPEQNQARIQGWLDFAAAQSNRTGGDPPAQDAESSAFAGEQSGFAPVGVSNNSNAPYQGEPAITASPANTLLVGGFNSIDPGKCSATLKNCAPGSTAADPSVGTWIKRNLPLAGNVLGFDPSIAIDSANNVYFSYGVCSGSCGTGNLLVAASTRSALLNASNAQPWTASQVTAPQGNIFDDKPWIAADPTTTGKVYVAWDRNQGNNQTLVVARKISTGWSSPVKINDGTSKFERVIYAMPTVARDRAANSSGCGTVYVVWMDYARKGLYVDKSRNCGVTWGTDVKAASLNITFTDIGCNGGRSMTPAPYIAVEGTNPATERVFVTFADRKGTTGMDVYIVYSLNGGSTWKGPYKVNSSTGNAAAHQYNPAMSVAGGQVHVSWLDRRNDSGNCLTATYSAVAASSSFAGAAPTFSANLDVTGGVESEFDGNPNGPGDYTGNASYVNGSTYGRPIFPMHPDGGTVAQFDIFSAQVTP